MSGWHGHAWHGPGPHPWDQHADDSLGASGRSPCSPVPSDPGVTATSLEAYLAEVQAEAHRVDERLHALRRAEAGHWPRRPDGHPARTSGRSTLPRPESHRPRLPHDGRAAIPDGGHQDPSEGGP